MSIRTKLLVKDISKTIAGMAKMSERKKRAYRSAMYMEAEEIMTESQREVPVDYGFLKNSKFIEEDKTTDGGVKFFLGYDIEYATKVHYTNLNYRHGKWRYLIDPMNRAASGMDARVAARMRVMM